MVTMEIWPSVSAKRYNSSKETLFGCAGNCQHYNSHHTRELLKRNYCLRKEVQLFKREVHWLCTILETVNITTFTMYGDYSKGTNVSTKVQLYNRAILWLCTVLETVSITTFTIHGDYSKGTSVSTKVQLFNRDVLWLCGTYSTWKCQYYNSHHTRGLFTIVQFTTCRVICQAFRLLYIY